MIKDYCDRHPDWIGHSKPPYSTFDPLYFMKLAQAKAWLALHPRRETKQKETK
jgi:hypothetical protein